MDECAHVWVIRIGLGGEPVEQCATCGDAYHGIAGRGYELYPPVA